MPPRVLYLHGLRGGPKSNKVKMLAQIYGNANVKAPNLGTRFIMFMYTLSFTIFIGCLIALSTIAFLYWTILGAIFLSLVLCLFGSLMYILTGRGVTYYMVQSAIKITEKTFKEFRPNVIVASSFGSVIAVQLNVPKVALVLLAPAQDAYCRYMRIKELFSIIDYPYVIIVHGGSDEQISLDDSIRLVETSNYGHCKLEVIDDNHLLKTLCDGDLKEFVDEAYEKAKAIILKSNITELEKPLKKKGPGYNVPTIDPSLFNIDKKELQNQSFQKEMTTQTESGASGELSPFTSMQHVEPSEK